MFLAHFFEEKSVKVNECIIHYESMNECELSNHTFLFTYEANCYNRPRFRPSKETWPQRKTYLRLCFELQGHLGCL